MIISIIILAVDADGVGFKAMQCVEKSNEVYKPILNSLCETNGALYGYHGYKADIFKAYLNGDKNTKLVESAGIRNITWLPYFSLIFIFIFVVSVISALMIGQCERFVFELNESVFEDFKDSNFKNQAQKVFEKAIKDFQVSNRIRKDNEVNENQSKKHAQNIATLMHYNDDDEVDFANSRIYSDVQLWKRKYFLPAVGIFNIAILAFFYFFVSFIFYDNEDTLLRSRYENVDLYLPFVIF